MSQHSQRLDIPGHCDTLPKLFIERVRMLSSRVAMRDKDFGIWQSVTWEDYGERAAEAGLALLDLGLAPGGRVAVAAEVCPEWLFTDLGVMGAGGICFGIYPTDTPPQVEYIMNDCGASFYAAGDEEQLDKILQVRHRVPSLKKIIVFDMEGLHHLNDPMVMSFDDLLAHGRSLRCERPGAWEARACATRPQDTAILVYTSGTTGPPKGAMISHANIMFQITGVLSLVEQTSAERTLAFLPLCHIAERTFTTFQQIAAGSTVHFVESPETVPENLREVRPTTFFAVPRVWEKFYSGTTIALKEATALQRLAYDAALAIGGRAASLRIAEDPVPAWLAAALWAADRLVLANVKRSLGIAGCRYVLSGAAPVSPDLIGWYYALGLYMAEGYGQTECTGIATLPLPWGSYKRGRVGCAPPGTELKIAPDGEILIRGPHVFQGYWGNAEKTAETIVDGWLHTGDVGDLDNSGWLRITDRKKDIIITAGGKNITPSEIENQLKFSPYIQDAVVIGDRRPYLTALVMIDHETVAKFAQDESVPFSDFASLCRAPAILDMISAEVSGVNAQFARVETVRKFRLIEHQIMAEDDEITATGKLRRAFVNEKYKALIQDMYGGRDAHGGQQEKMA